QVQGLNPGEYAVAKEGIQVYKPLAPGKNEFSMTYSVPGNNLPATLTKKVGFETKELFAVTPIEALSVKSDLLKPEQSYQISGKVYQQYYGQNIKVGSDVVLTLDKGQPQQQSTAAPSNKVAAGYKAKLHPDAHMKLFTSDPLVYTNPHIWAAYLIIMVVLGIAALILLYKRRANREDAEQEQAEADLEDDDEEFLRLNTKQEMLLQKIKDLDEALKEGKIGADEHRETREKLKQMLVRVKMQLRELT
ncbi:MAG TPA: hypothetical protein VNU93_07805, partial [Verrucomicrobiae bacterium]|nr:hypothetical protein [Verrucomicrobiae bacterium]